MSISQAPAIIPQMVMFDKEPIHFFGIHHLWSHPFVALEAELWQEKLADAIDRRQQMSDYLCRSLEIWPSGTG